MPLPVQRPREQVAGFAGDPDRATDWYDNIRNVEWRTPRPLQVGSQFVFVARFLGRTLAYTYELREWLPGERLLMSTSDGPFAMQTTYTWQGTPSGGTRMVLRNRGEPSGFVKVGAPLMATAVRKADDADLRWLKQLLESSPRCLT